jgi:predicted methyltransferase
MRRIGGTMGLIATLFFLGALAGAAGAAEPGDPALRQAIDSPGRSPKFVARDAARHPAEELTFFGIRPDQTVVEIWPSGGYWTEILAPYLRANGRLYAATTAPGASAEEDAQLARFRRKLESDLALYNKVILTAFGAQANDVAPAGSADLVVTFRNLHNWLKAGYADAAFAAFYRALKPGGILGIEEHRARPDKPQDPTAANGYVREDYAIELATKAGFILLATSEIGANPKDTTDWPKGVWTLPPTLALGDVDRARYEVVGEADNFVLKFRKPAN